MKDWWRILRGKHLVIIDSEESDGIKDLDHVGFSGEWDSAYKSGSHHSIWPWSDIVSLCERYVRPRLQLIKEPAILEIGCGYGANIPYLRTLGRYFGVDGSATALAANQKRYPELIEYLCVADFTSELGFDRKFEVICDRASITHNSDNKIRECIDLVRQGLKIGGIFVGVTWFSKAHSDCFAAPIRVDDYTCSGFTQGQFDGVGLVHFTDEQNLLEIFSDFDIVHLQHRVSYSTIPADGSIKAYYNFVAIRRS